MNAHHISRGLTAIIVLFAIGCADGQRQKNGTNGKGKHMLKTQGPGGKTSTAKTDGTTTLPTTADSAKQKIIDDTIAQMSVGTANPEFKNGTYQLVSTTTFFSDWVPSEPLQAVSTTTYAPEQNFTPTPGATTAVGVLSAKITQPSRAIGVPLAFAVTSGTSGQPAIQSLDEQILTSTLSTKVTAVSITETMAPAPAASKLGLTNLLNTTEKYDDGKGITATLDAKMTDTGDVRFVIQIEEKLADQSIAYRNFFLTYRLKPEAAKAPEKTAPMTPAEADAAVAAKR